MKLVHLKDVAPQPWRNGGGQTRELLTWPEPGNPSWDGGFAQHALFTVVPGILRSNGASTPLPANTLAWQSDAGGALAFDPDPSATGLVGWWLGYSPG